VVSNGVLAGALGVAVDDTAAGSTQRFYAVTVP
jgi:hypothetical protein